MLQILTCFDSQLQPRGLTAVTELAAGGLRYTKSGSNWVEPAYILCNYCKHLYLHHYIDGIWKIRYKTCSALRPKTDVSVASAHYPRNCTSPPMSGCAFCKQCGDQVKKLGIPLILKDFLVYCGCNVSKYSKTEKQKRNVELERISAKINIKSDTIGTVTGTDRILRSSAIKEKENFQVRIDGDIDCNKGG